MARDFNQAKCWLKASSQKPFNKSLLVFSLRAFQLEDKELFPHFPHLLLLAGLIKKHTLWVQKGDTMDEWADGSRWNVRGSVRPVSLSNWHKRCILLIQFEEDIEAALQPFLLQVRVLFILGIQPRHIWILFKMESFMLPSSSSALCGPCVLWAALAGLRHLSGQSGLKALRFSWRLGRIIWLHLE